MILEGDGGERRWWWWWLGRRGRPWLLRRWLSEGVLGAPYIEVEVGIDLSLIVVLYWITTRSKIIAVVRSGDGKYGSRCSEDLLLVDSYWMVPSPLQLILCTNHDLAL